MQQPGSRLLRFGQVDLVENFPGMKQCNATTRNNTLCNRSAGCMQGVFVQRLPLFHLGFGRGANLQLGNTTSQLGKPLLQLFLVVIAVSALNFATNQLAAPFQRFLVASTFGYGRVLAVDPYLLGPAKISQLHIGQRNTQILENRFTLGQGCNVFKHGFAAVTITRSLDSANLQNTLQLVQDQCSEGLTLHIFSNDHQRGLGLADLLKQRHQILGVADFFLVNQNVRIVEFNNHFVLIGHKVGRQITAVKLHALDHHNFGFGSLAFLNCDNAVAGTDLLHRLGKLLANLSVVIGSNGRHFSEALLVVGVDFLRHRTKRIDHLGNRLGQTAGNGHRVVTRSNQLQAFSENGFSQNRGSRCTITGYIVGLAGRFFD